MLDSDLDWALETAGATLDEAARKAAYQVVAERINADKGHIVLYNRLRLEAFKSYVKGHVTNVWSDLAWDTANWWLDK